MTKQQAREHIASMLAVISADHIRAMNGTPQLAENTESALKKNWVASLVLGIQREYTSKMAIHAPRCNLLSGKASY